MMLIILSMTFSILFVFMSHPLSLGLILLVQTTLISMMSGKFCLNFWFSYILFLIMIGGMLILFIYMTSVASNEKFTINSNSIMFLSIMVLLSTLTTFMENSMIELPYKNDLISIKIDTLHFSMIKFTSFPMSMILVFMIVYLLIVLIAVVKIIDNKQGPLRSKN
uniref:NADH-ubiquinone oxidoreductase chain 6 n=1 Tax=Pseudabris przewalskyi TaxID=3047135 RepID=A0AA51RGX1_9CUCU|nr:NADH dehydrogenase subunit 6 [Pseudabris przewalskyi]WMQ52485.1 NADH dehydrogenase subunit 6 [Pseudabris przewalskyi]